MTPDVTGPLRTEGTADSKEVTGLVEKQYEPVFYGTKITLSV